MEESRGRNEVTSDDLMLERGPNLPDAAGFASAGDLLQMEFVTLEDADLRRLEMPCLFVGVCLNMRSPLGVRLSLLGFSG
jgi:hypothetical protein